MNKYSRPTVSEQLHLPIDFVKMVCSINLVIFVVMYFIIIIMLLYVMQWTFFKRGPYDTLADII